MKRSTTRKQTYLTLMLFGALGLNAGLQLEFQSPGGSANLSSDISIRRQPLNSQTGGTSSSRSGGQRTSNVTVVASEGGTPQKAVVCEDVTVTRGRGRDRVEKKQRLCFAGVDENAQYEDENGQSGSSRVTQYDIRLFDAVGRVEDTEASLSNDLASRTDLLFCGDCDGAQNSGVLGTADAVARILFVQAREDLKRQMESEMDREINDAQAAKCEGPGYRKGDLEGDWGKCMIDRIALAAEDRDQDPERKSPEQLTQELKRYIDSALRSNNEEKRVNAQMLLAELRDSVSDPELNDIAEGAEGVAIYASSMLSQSVVEPQLASLTLDAISAKYCRAQPQMNYNSWGPFYMSSVDYSNNCQEQVQQVMSDANNLGNMFVRGGQLDDGFSVTGAARLNELMQQHRSNPLVRESNSYQNLLRLLQRDPYTGQTSTSFLPFLQTVTQNPQSLESLSRQFPTLTSEIYGAINSPDFRNARGAGQIATDYLYRSDVSVNPFTSTANNLSPTLSTFNHSNNQVSRLGNRALGSRTQSSFRTQSLSGARGNTGVTSNQSLTYTPRGQSQVYTGVTPSYSNSQVQPQPQSFQRRQLSSGNNVTSNRVNTTNSRTGNVMWNSNL